MSQTTYIIKARYKLEAHHSEYPFSTRSTARSYARYLRGRGYRTELVKRQVIEVPVS